jgi:hypothetical protein
MIVSPANEGATTVTKLSINKLAKNNRSKKKRGKKKQPSWNEMSAGRKAGVLAMGTAQMALAATAWRDLAKRPAAAVNGRKGIWAAIIAVNWVGPIAYFVKGRRAAA